MSGRTRWERDGKLIVGYRKTNRRQRPSRTLAERLADLNLKLLKQPRPVGDEPAVHLAFLLPQSLQGFVADGHHGVGVNVVGQGFVQVSGHSAEQCFVLTAAFFADVAKSRAAFTTYASILSAKDPGRSYGRHLVVVRGALIVAGGYVTPKVFERDRHEL